MPVIMKIFTLIGLFIGLAESLRPNEKCWRECDWSEYKILIKCPDDPSEPCTCESKDETLNNDCLTILGADNLRFSGFEDCQKLAMDNQGADLASQYFRWEDKDTEDYCFFLPDCIIEVPSGCVPFPTAKCVAGPSTEPCEDAPAPAQACAHAEWFDEGLHWKCRNGLETVSPYKDEKIPQGTTCQTDGDCPAWTWVTGDAGHEDKKKQAKVICEGGEWKSDPADLGLNNATATAKATVSMLPDQDDGFCLCDSFEVTGEMRDNPSLSFLCDDILYPNDANVTLIEYPNTCLALCDGHMVKYLECYKGQWTNTAEYPFHVVEDIPC